MNFLYNVAHPMAESGRPIFIPFGEWDYDGTCRQRLDRAHGARIANKPIIASLGRTPEAKADRAVADARAEMAALPPAERAAYYREHAAEIDG